MKNLLAVIFLLTLVCAESLNPKELSSAVISLDFSGRGSVEGSFETVNLTMFTVPVSDSRQTAQCDVGPSVNYIFEKGDLLEYDYSCTVKTKQIGTEIVDSSLPLTDAPEEFLEQTELTELTPELKEKAEELATESLLETAYEINSWVYETIEYDTAYAFSLFAGAEQQTRTPESTYEKKLGICGDKAHLAIGMLRHLGIPARYVAGSSYGRLAEEKFESHAWVEVWFPNTGWVPFDPTYGEYGYVDPSHVKFYHSLDSTFPVWQTRYSYYERQPVISWERDEETRFVSIEEGNNFEAEIETVERAEYGDYVLVTATAKNNLPIPAIADVQLYYTAGNLRNNFEVVWGEESQLVWLLEGEEKNVYWVLEAPVLDEGKYYVMPLTARVEGESVETTLKLYPREQTPLLTLTTESDSYDEGDRVRMTLEISPGGPETVVVLPSGEIIGFGSGEQIKTAYSVASEDLAAWSQSGAFAEAGIRVEAQTLDVSVTAPKKVAQGKVFDITIEVDGQKGRSVRLDFQGQSSVATLPATFNVQTSLVEDQTLMFSLQSGGKTKMVSRRFTVVPTPEVSHRFLVPERIVAGVPTQIAASGNGEVILSTDYGSKEGNRSVLFEITPDVCGKNSARIEVTVQDELGNEFRESFDEEFEVLCGLDSWIAKIMFWLEGLLT